MRQHTRGDRGSGGGGGRGGKHLAPPFTCFLPPGLALCKLGSARSAVLPEFLTLVLGPFSDLPLFYFGGFSLPCLFATAILDSFPYSNYLTFPAQEMGGPILWE